MCLAAACLPPGQKLLRLEVHQAGQVVLATVFDAADSCTVSEIWDEAGECPFSTEVTSTSLVPGDEDPLAVVLTGPVEIRITHVRSLESSATLTGLRLVRSAPTTDDWRLPPEEIARAKKAAGL